MTMETNNPNTILLLESGDLEVYDGKRPKIVQPRDTYVHGIGYMNNDGFNYNNWLSTKRIVKMADSESAKLFNYLTLHRRIKLSRYKNYPIDVSDIVEIRKIGSKDDLIGEWLGYFKEPVREGETPQDILNEFYVINDDKVQEWSDKKRLILEYNKWLSKHFTINRK